MGDDSSYLRKNLQATYIRDDLAKYYPDHNIVVNAISRSKAAIDVSDKCADLYVDENPSYSPWADTYAKLAVFHPYHLETMPIKTFAYSFAHELYHVLHGEDKRNDYGAKNYDNNYNLAANLHENFTSDNAVHQLYGVAKTLISLPKIIKDKYLYIKEVKESERRANNFAYEVTGVNFECVEEYFSNKNLIGLEVLDEMDSHSYNIKFVKSLERFDELMGYEESTNVIKAQKRNVTPQPLPELQEVFNRHEAKNTPKKQI